MSTQTVHCLGNGSHDIIQIRMTNFIDLLFKSDSRYRSTTDCSCGVKVPATYYEARCWCKAKLASSRLVSWSCVGKHRPFHWPPHSSKAWRHSSEHRLSAYSDSRLKEVRHITSPSFLGKDRNIPAVSCFILLSKTDDMMARRSMMSAANRWSSQRKSLIFSYRFQMVLWCHFLHIDFPEFSFTFFKKLLLEWATCVLLEWGTGLLLVLSSNPASFRSMIEIFWRPRNSEILGVVLQREETYQWLLSCRTHLCFADLWPCRWLF